MSIDLLLDPYANYNASSLVLVIANIISVVVIVHWMTEMMANKNVGLRQLFHVRPLRMLLGAAIIFAGVIIGCAMWLPAFPILLSGDVDLLNWYIATASWPSNFGNMLSIVGMSILMWPWLIVQFGRWTVLVVASFAASVYLFGLVASIFLGAMIAQWTF